MGNSGSKSWPDLCFLAFRMTHTHTDFLVRDKSGKYEPLFKTKEVQNRVVDGALVLAFLSVFVGLVFLLSK